MTSDENKHYYTCRFCGSQYKSFKHTLSEEYEVTPYVSSTNMGTHCKVCTVCGYKANEETHKFVTTNGYIEHTQIKKGGVGVTMTCSVCGYKYETIVWEDKEFNHIWEHNKENETENTYTKTCRICGATQTESKEQYDGYQEQLKKAKTSSYNDFLAYITERLNKPEKYNVDSLVKIFNAGGDFDTFKELNDAAETIEDVESILKNYKAKIEYEYKIGGLVDVKKNSEDEIEKAVEATEKFFEDEHSIGWEVDLEVLDMQDEYNDKISKAETIEEVEKLKKEFLDWIAKYMEENK